MPLRFAWDPRKASANLRKHGVSFWDAASAFEDPLSITIPDPLHSETEERLVLIGVSRKQHSWWSPMSSAATSFESSALVLPAALSGSPMKKASNRKRARAVREEMLPEYDFSKGVRNKYAARFAEGTNLILLAPDVAAEFTSSDAVNRALRAVIKSRAKRRTA